MTDDADHPALTRRQVLTAAGGAGLLTAAGAGVLGAAPRALAATAPSAGGGTPEQVHLTWGDDPATSVVVSWASSGPAAHPRIRMDGHGYVPAVTQIYTDGINGEQVWAYHARVGGLRPGTGYSYTVTADNDAHAGAPFAGSFQTAPRGRAGFRFTSFGDLATPNTQWVLSYGQSAQAVGAVESFRPLFHLLNGDLCYANLNPLSQPSVWRDFGNNNQASAAHRPWMPCLGNHEVEFDNGPQGYTSYLTRYHLPDNGVPGFGGRWYAFRVGAALFVSLDASDVIYQDGAAFVGGPAPLTPAASTGNAPIPAPSAAPGDLNWRAAGCAGVGSSAVFVVFAVSARSGDPPHGTGRPGRHGGRCVPTVDRPPVRGSTGSLRGGNRRGKSLIIAWLMAGPAPGPDARTPPASLAGGAPLLGAGLISQPGWSVPTRSAPGRYGPGRC